jgi:serine/threonine-protein phosphatase 2A regulatory subunit B'
MKLIQRVKRQISTEQGGSAAAGAGGATRVKSDKAKAPQKTRKEAAPTDENPFTSLPLLRETPAAERPEVLKKKLQACSITFDFNTQTCLGEKEAKRATLLELVEYVTNTRHSFNDAVIKDVVDMVTANILRVLPPPRASSVDEGDEDPSLEASWPHLQIVYEFFLRFVVSHDVDPKIAKKFIDQNFVLRLLALFDSEDPRERDYLKTILHRLYGKIMSLRLFIRKAIQSLFFQLVGAKETHMACRRFWRSSGRSLTASRCR